LALARSSDVVVTPGMQVTTGAPLVVLASA